MANQRRASGERLKKKTGRIKVRGGGEYQHPCKTIGFNRPARKRVKKGRTKNCLREFPNLLEYHQTQNSFGTKKRTVLGSSSKRTVQQKVQDFQKSPS